MDKLLDPTSVPDWRKDLQCFYNWDGVCKRDGADVQIKKGQCESCADFCVESWRLDSCHRMTIMEENEYEIPKR